MTGNGPGGERRVVIGVGNEYRRDDGFGPAVAARLAELRAADPRLSTVDIVASDGEPTRLIDLWTGAELAVVVDAVHDGRDHGGHRYELVLDELAQLAGDRSASSHGITLGTTVELGRLLGRLPRRLVVVAVGGSEFGFGTGLTPAVAAQVGPVVERVRDLVGGPARAAGHRPRAAPPPARRSSDASCRACPRRAVVAASELRGSASLTQDDILPAIHW